MQVHTRTPKGGKRLSYASVGRYAPPFTVLTLRILPECNPHNKWRSTVNSLSIAERYSMPARQTEEEVHSFLLHSSSTLCSKPSPSRQEGRRRHPILPQTTSSNCGGAAPPLARACLFSKPTGRKGWDAAASILLAWRSLGECLLRLLSCYTVEVGKSPLHSQLP